MTEPDDHFSYQLYHRRLIPFILAHLHIAAIYFTLLLCHQSFKYESPGFMKLAAQRPRILLAAIEERSSVSAAVLYSDVDAVWRSNPLPTLSPLLPQYDVVGAQDEHLICTGFFMFSTG
jgi:hypothetical protein